MRWAILAIFFLASAAQGSRRIFLRDHWRIQDSAQVAADGAALSQQGFNDGSWNEAIVPSTILGNLIPPITGTGTPDDPFMGENLLKLPGSGSYYPIGTNFGDVVTPPESPFGRGWWYRRSFVAPATAGERVDLDFAGITYGAEIWLNGKRLSAKEETRGTYRAFSFDITGLLDPSGNNTLAVQVFPPLPTDLTPSWVDWNPTPQDKNMGLWREVSLRIHGPVRVDHPQVLSEINLPSASEAGLTVETDLSNESAQPVHGKIHGSIRFLGRFRGRSRGESIDFEQTVDVAAGEHKTVRLDSSQIPALLLKNPRLWWPWQMGQPNLYHLVLEYVGDNRVSDRKEIDFGIRKIDSALNSSGARLFSINGIPIEIRGGGWSSDLFLRFSKQRELRELNYVRNLGLNTVRLEGRFEPASFLDLADRMGILVMPGWVCCNAWQNNKAWDPSNYAIAAASIRDQIYEFRSHASVFTFLYGSDEAPPADIEKIYTDALTQFDFPDPVIASAAATDTPINGKSGFKMNGPYDYTPPSYWYVDGKHGGAFGFNTETSPGASMPPIEALEKFIPADHLNEIDENWIFHTGGNDFHSLDTLKDGVTRRYGAPRDAMDFVKKAELSAYDNHRAMFEAFGKNKYHPATGVIQWMLNNAWPSLIWHLWDYDLRPDAAYFGVKKATAPVHVQYSYDDQSIVAVNSTYQDQKDLRVVATTYDLQMKLLEHQEKALSVSADSTTQAFTLGVPNGTYFVKLELQDPSGLTIDDNFYWLSSQKEIYNWDATDFRMTPVTQEADLSALSGLPSTSVTAQWTWNRSRKKGYVVIRNAGVSLAFFIHLKLLESGTEALPVFWGDNYISLLPGESKLVEVAAPDSGDGKLELQGSGWNVPRFSAVR